MAQPTLDLPATHRPEAHRPEVTTADRRLLTARLVGRHRTGRRFTGAVALAVVAFAVQSAVRNPNFQWSIIWEYVRAPDVIGGLWLTIWLTVVVLATGYVVGVVLAAMRLSANPVLRWISFGYVWLVRSIPALVQLLLWYEMASLYPNLSLGIPFGPTFFHHSTKHLFSGELAAYIALSIEVSAFAAEIVRGGLVAVDHGQVEAAQSIGLPPRRIFRRIVLPQAMPAIVPASGNLLLTTVKLTAIVSFIAVPDLLYSTQLIYGQNYRVIPLLIVATFWYVVLTTVISIGQYFVERHYARGTHRDDGRTFKHVLSRNLPLRDRALRDQLNAAQS